MLDNFYNMIQEGKGFKTSCDGNFGRALADMLTKDGWKYFDTHSKCSVAWFESHLKKDNKEVEIIVSSFMGVFTEVGMRVY